MPSVLITGASRGLGFALSQEFDKVGYMLLLVVRTCKAKLELEQQFKYSKILVADVTAENYESLLNEFLFDLVVDVVINNAGSGSNGSCLETAVASQLRKEFETHCVAAFSTVRASLNCLFKSDNALILNISSRRGSLTMQSQGAAKGSGCSFSYRIGKASQNMLTLCLADELEDSGIIVAAIHPGRLLTKLASSDANMTPEKSAEKIVSLIENNQIKSRDYLCIETGSLSW